MWVHHQGFFLFPHIIFLVILALVVFRIFFFRGRHLCGGRFDNRREAERILMERLARGEIDEEEYRRIRDILYK